ncbi:MAG: glycosyltransferase [Gemmatimonadetes bacterium]|nr:glycosyltransferase [Gemmatimonadota bacterium]
MRLPSLTLVVPARNEEACLPSTLASSGEASRRYRAAGGTVETIVSDNDSSDATAEIALACGARVTRERRRSISAVRNAGAAAAAGEALVFCDADTRISSNLMLEVGRTLRAGRYVGGGLVRVRTSRISPGILASASLLAPLVLRNGLAGVVFWTWRETFRELGGFDPDILVAEDVHFALRLRSLGRQRGLRYGFLPRASAVTSARRFDALGDWWLVRNPRILRDIYAARVREEDAWRTHYAGR